MISCSHWGMIPADWPAEALIAPEQFWNISFDFEDFAELSYDAKYLHG